MMAMDTPSVYRNRRTTTMAMTQAERIRNQLLKVAGRNDHSNMEYRLNSVEETVRRFGLEVAERVPHRFGVDIHVLMGFPGDVLVIRVYRDLGPMELKSSIQPHWSEIAMKGLTDTLAKEYRMYLRARLLGGVDI